MIYSLNLENSSNEILFQIGIILSLINCNLINFDFTYLTYCNYLQNIMFYPNLKFKISMTIKKKINMLLCNIHAQNEKAYNCKK